MSVRLHELIRCVAWLNTYIQTLSCWVSLWHKKKHILFSNFCRLRMNDPGVWWPRTSVVSYFCWNIPLLAPADKNSNFDFQCVCKSTLHPESCTPACRYFCLRTWVQSYNPSSIRSIYCEIVLGVKSQCDNKLRVCLWSFLRVRTLREWHQVVLNAHHFDRLIHTLGQAKPQI